MNSSPLIMLAVFVLIAIQYLFEVHVGSPIGMYDADSGALSAGCVPRRSTHGQFLGRVAPLQLAAIGLPLLGHEFLSGVLMVLFALLLFSLHKEANRPPRFYPTTNASSKTMNTF